MLEINQQKLERLHKDIKSTLEVGIDNQSKNYEKRARREELDNVLNRTKFGIIEKKFLKFLAKDFKPKTIAEIMKSVSTKDCKHAKKRVAEKLTGTGFSIRTIRSKSWDGDSFYQLAHATDLKNQ